MTGASKLSQKSPAEFFAENKSIAGFDNVRALSLCIVAWQEDEQTR
jgi:DNA topoisomerase VI subunit B